MRAETPIIIVRVLKISLIQFATVALWCLFFVVLNFSNSENCEDVFRFIVVIIDWGILAGIIALNIGISNYYSEVKVNVSSLFYGKRLKKSEVEKIVNQTYSKAKIVIAIIHLAAIVLFNLACGIIKSHMGFIQTVILTFPTNIYRIIFRIIGTAGFIISMVKYCKSNFKIEVVVCPHCGKVTRYNVDKTKSFRESWTENKYYIKSDEWGEVYHPGSYEYEYQCIYCGYNFKKVEEE